MTVNRFTFNRSRLRNISGAEAAIAVKIGAEFLLQQSKKDVPHDTGMLENSGSVDFNAAKPEATVFYDTPYAKKLHEHPEYNFGKGRSGKWLEKAATNKKSEILNIIADRMRGAFR